MSDTEQTKALPGPNLLDRALSPFAPGYVAKRVKARQTLALSGGFEGGSYKRSLRNWFAPVRSANAALEPDRRELINRSRDLARNNAVAAGAINRVVTHSVGVGLRPRPSIDREALGLSDEDADAWERAALREFNLAADTPEFDATRTLSFYAMQPLVMRSALEGGDLFSLRLLFERPGSPYRTKFQLIEAERVSNPNNQMDREKITGGVEVDQRGAPIAYHVAERHPGEGMAAVRTQWKRVPIFGPESGQRRIFHHYVQLRPEQRRGVPYLAPVIDALKQLSRYSEAEIMAAVINSCFAITMKSNEEDGSAGLESGGEDQHGEPISITEAGTIVNLGTDEEVQGFQPGRPGTQFEPFYHAVLKEIGMALEIPFEMLLANFQSSFSASKAALELAWQMFMTRREWLARSFCQPAYEAVLVEAIAEGRLSAPGFFTDPAVRRAYCGCEWIGPAKPVFDDVKDAKGAAQRIGIGISSIEREAAMRGGNWEALHKQRAQEVRRRREDGVETAPPSPDGGSPPAQGRDEGEDERDDQ